MTRWLVALALLDVAWLGSGAFLEGGQAWALAAHAVISTLAYALWLRDGGVIGFAPAMLGLLGPVGLLLGQYLSNRRPSLAARPEEAVFGPRPARVARRGASLATARMLDGRVHHAGPDTLSSLHTVLRHGDVAARRRAVETIVRSFEPALSPLIALALTDKDQTIRALAAAASSRVVQNLAVAREGLTVAQDDPEAAARLAALLAKHARADVLLSDSQRAHLRTDALALMPAEEPQRLMLMVEALWAAGDLAAIDTLLGDLPADAPADLLALSRWWQAEAAA